MHSLVTVRNAPRPKPVAVEAGPSPASTRAAQHPSAAGERSRPRPAPDRLFLAVLLAIPAGVTLIGLPYYALDRADRVRHAAHPWLRSSGPVGLGLGLLGFLLFLFMWLYPLRKRFRWLQFTGAVAEWLRIHAAAGIALPLLIAVHAGWRFDGLIGLGYGALILVSLSGVVGRYLYGRIPRSQSGIELTLDEVANERRALITRIAVTVRLDPLEVERALTIDAQPYTRLGPLRTLARLVADDWARRRAIRELARRWARPRPGARPLDRRSLDAVMRLARRELSLSQQARMLATTRQLFGYWHVAHRPVAITALLAVLIHVVVALAVGAVHLG